MNILLLLSLLSFVAVPNTGGEINNTHIWLHIECDEEYQPDNCDFDRIPDLTVEDFERCAPALLPLYVRNYYLGWNGRGLTYKWNREAYQKIRIIPKMLRDVSETRLEITTLGQKVSFPVGISPTAVQSLSNPDGEIATALAAAEAGAVMILSCYATTTIEDIAAVVPPSTNLWMQAYIFKNRNYTIDIVRRAERNGFKAIVLTCDSPFISPAVCNAKKNPGIANIQLANIPEKFHTVELLTSTTFDDITWLRSITRLPIVAKGILNGEDAQKVVKAGASAILVSNHGGRQLDSDISSIDALPEVVEAINKISPSKSVDIYLDGGIRNGYDIYKAIARGAKMVFIGRPTIWGLVIGGKDGVKKVLDILKTEFNNTMILAGFRNPNEIQSSTISPSKSITEENWIDLDSLKKILCKNHNIMCDY